MELLSLFLIGLLIPAVLASVFAGRPRHGWIGAVAVLVPVGAALILTAQYGWPFDTCYTDGGCWEGLILIPIYASAALAALAFGVAAFIRRPTKTPETSVSHPQSKEPDNVHPD